MKRPFPSGFSGFAVLLLIGASAAKAADWPQFLGPYRNGATDETGLATRWSAEGPKVRWRFACGKGYSQIAVVKGRAYTLIQRDDHELAVALDADSGKELWAKPLGKAFDLVGPATTPAVEGDRLYVQSLHGPLFCLKTETGETVWERDLLKQFAARHTHWGMTVSPAIEGNLLLTVSGGKGAGVVALDKQTGELVWKNSDDKLGFASPMVVSVGGRKRAIFLTSIGVVATQLDDGKVLWTYEWNDGGSDLNAASPLVIGERLFLSDGYRGALLAPAQTGEPKAVWTVGKEMNTYWSTAVHHQGHLYGLAGGFSGATHLNCVDAATGKLVWSQERFGKANLTLADGHLYILTVAGELVVAPATPECYREKGRAQLLTGGRHANAPAIAGKQLYIRDSKTILCLDIASP